ncbi:MAG TPA: phosphoglycerate mutase family protein [Pyrinomonadaceae bacterium]|nr:phosphoglycerate mutase family protein [Pyrinomonadaceae bacterium]
MKQQNPRSLLRLKLVVYCLALIVAFAGSGFSAANDEVKKSSMTVILVRHAEKHKDPKNPEDKDPDISGDGQTRAQLLAKMFGDSGVSAVYATQYKRTHQTVKPLATKVGIPVTIIESKMTAELIQQMRERNAGQVVFLAGHNTTVPEIIGELGGPKLPMIPETEYDNLFILQVHSDGTAKLLKLKY